jgi:hypothetical protein
MLLSVQDLSVRFAGTGIALIRGLLRLRIPTDLYSPEFDSVRLKAPEIESLFFGHRVHGRMPRGGREYGASVAADGTGEAKHAIDGDSSSLELRFKPFRALTRIRLRNSGVADGQ